MEVDNIDDDPRSADTMEEITPTHVVEGAAGRIDSISTSPLVLEGSPLEEGQIFSPHHSRPPSPTTSPCDEEVQALPFSEPSFIEPDNVLNSATQNMETPTASVVDPHCQEPQNPDQGKANAIDRDWASGWGNDGWGTPTAAVVANQDKAPMSPNGDGKGKERGNWDSGWSTNNPVTPMASHATILPPAISSSAVPATTTVETTNIASVNSLQEAPQPTTEKSANNSWGSWGANSGWGSPVPAGRTESGWSAPAIPTGGNESWGVPCSTFAHHR